LIRGFSVVASAANLLSYV
jgi:hypothetical protein